SSPPRSALFAGRIHPMKGLEVAVEALASVQGLTLTVVGPEDDPKYVARVRAIARERGVDGRIGWRGEVARDEVVGLLGTHDVLLYPSVGVEAYSLGLLEGLAAGILVVTSAQGGPEEYLRD
ncbi:MAG: glycosyltransferase family 4 protein, partial [Actinobacteria bacterium]